MSTTNLSKYIRQIDFATFNADRKRFNQRLLDRSNSEIASCAINYVRTPPNGGTPGGEHVHDYDQFMFLLSGRMMVKIEGEVYPVGPGTLMIYPAGVPHHFWNLDEETIHITVMAPAPDPEKPRSTPIGVKQAGLDQALANQAVSNQAGSNRAGS